MSRSWLEDRPDAQLDDDEQVVHDEGDDEQELFYDQSKDNELYGKGEVNEPEMGVAIMKTVKKNTA